LDGVMDAVVAVVKNDGAADGPWELPEGWAWATLNNLIGSDGLMVDGDWVESKDQDPGGAVRLIQLADIGQGDFLDKSSRFLTDVTARRLRCTFLRKNDILIARMASPLGRACTYPGLSQPAVTVVDVCIWRNNRQLIEPRWLMNAINSLQCRRAIMADASGTTRQRVSGGKLKNISVPVPPLAEQRRIVTRVDALFAEIAEGEAALAESRKGLDTFRRALLKAAVTGELTKDWRAANPVTETGHDLLVRIAKDRAAVAPTKGQGRRRSKAMQGDTSVLPELPNGWAWEGLSALGDFGRGKSRHRPRDDARLYGGSMPFVQTGVVANSDDFIQAFQQTYSEFGVAQSRVWPPGTVCITIAANIAKTAITTFECCFPDSIVGLTPVRAIDSYWIHIWIKTIQQRLERFAPATAQKNINLEVLDAVMVPIPPPAEAEEILRRVSDGLAASADTLASLDAEAADAARLKQSILKAAFEGRLVPQDPADEPASALLARLAANPPLAPVKRRRGRKSSV
jgi:type I restriction enzyme S subunit